MSAQYFQKLKTLIDSGRLRTHIIVAPPRTNSSLVEHALGNSPDIEHECHEPFLNARLEDFDPDDGYQQIYEAIGGEEFERSGGETSVVIKEMSHWIAKDDEYKRLFEIATDPIIILIRNPLLSVESRIRRVLTTIDMRYSIDLQRYLLNEIAVEKDCHDWLEFAEKMKEEGYTERPSFLQNKEAIERIYGTPVLTVQNQLLNLKARNNGYANWRDLIEKKLYIERDYKFFDGILGSNERRLGFEKDEFVKLAEEVKYLEEQEKGYFVFDTTDLRAAPNEYMQELCKRLEVTFTPEMTRWSKKPIDFYTQQTHEHERLWYDTLYSSSRINPPIEIPPTIDQFPTFMQTYLKVSNLPIYAVLSKEKVLSEELRKELNERKIRVKITAANKEHMHALGVLTDTDKTGEYALIKLMHIDPIYAVSNDPDLASKPEFQTFVQAYLEEINIVLENFAESNEHAREIEALSTETKFC